ncbi:MAG: Rieske 2Fe-2S domain-containing protein [Caldithrix sp.]|nr:Rieske 2Fe-2S domain-containing protein [Caldithrix sp.]
MKTRREVIAKIDDLQDGEMTTVYLDDTDILLIKQDGRFYAMGGYCPHHGAPLEMGVLSKHHLTCPWHQACFDLRNGDLIDPPALDALPSYKTIIEDDNVLVELPDKVEESRIPQMTKEDPKNHRQFVIIGGGAAGHAAAQTLRQDGFTGKIRLISRDTQLPYDRTALSKEYLQGKLKPDRLPLRQQSFYDEYKIDLSLNTAVKSLAIQEKKCSLEDGTAVSFDKLLIATGSRPKMLPVPGIKLNNVFTLRHADDAQSIRDAAEKCNHVVMIGAGFIGMEVADSLRKMDKPVTVVAPEAVPFAPLLGDEIGQLFKTAHEDNGVRFMLNSSIQKIDGGDAVQKVVLQSGKQIEADMVIVGIGVEPVTDFIQDIELEKDKSIRVDSRLAVSEHVFAAGDAVTFPYAPNEQNIRVEHWRVAQQQGKVAAKNMLGNTESFDKIPFFWTDQAGLPLRYTGFAPDWDEIYYDGEVYSKNFIAYYLKNEQVVAAAACNRDEQITIIASLLANGKMPSAEKIKSKSLNLKQLIHEAD